MSGVFGGQPSVGLSKTTQLYTQMKSDKQLLAVVYSRDTVDPGKLAWSVAHLREKVVRLSVGSSVVYEHTHAIHIVETGVQGTYP